MYILGYIKMMRIKFHKCRTTMKVIKGYSFFFFPIIIILRLRKNIKICLMFLSSICLGMRGTLDIRIYVYKGIEVWEEEHIPKNIMSDVLDKGKKKHVEKLLKYIIWDFQNLSFNPWFVTCCHNSRSELLGFSPWLYLRGWVNPLIQWSAN